MNDSEVVSLFLGSAIFIVSLIIIIAVVLTADRAGRIEKSTKLITQQLDQLIELRRGSEKR